MNFISILTTWHPQKSESYASLEQKAKLENCRVRKDHEERRAKRVHRRTARLLVSLCQQDVTTICKWRPSLRDVEMVLFTGSSLLFLFFARNFISFLSSYRVKWKPASRTCLSAWVWQSSLCFPVYTAVPDESSFSLCSGDKRPLGIIS